MIGERLAEIRKDYGDTQQSLAQRLGIAVPTVSAWEQGKSSPSHDTLVAICQMYHTSADYLLGLSNVDPIFSKKNWKRVLTDDELSEVQKFCEYLLWKRKQKEM